MAVDAKGQAEPRAWPRGDGVVFYREVAGGTMSDLTTWQAMADFQRERAQEAEESLRKLMWARHFVDEVALTLGLNANEELDKIRVRLREVVGPPQAQRPSTSGTLPRA